ncbi:MAG TPA: SDR family NAD(P)-dependent oxidoreductase [Chitinophagales bacterium]|nr:SDR family NAD(P)-dependent oxidoreductase [Chitinophagales bacterium]
MMKRILITGGAGFIGSNLSLQLLKRGYKVVVLDCLSPQIHGNKEESTLYQSIKDTVEFIEADVRDRVAMANAVKDADVVVHLAAETGTGQSMYAIEKYIDVNCTGTGVLLDVLLNEPNQVKKVVLSSSRAVYGEGKYTDSAGNVVYPPSRPEAQMRQKKFELLDPQGAPLKLQATDEHSQINPLSLYAITKYNQEQYISLTCASIGMPYVIFRYQNVYGPGQSLKNPYTGILSIFSTQIKNGNNINVFEDGLESRDFVFIDDVVHATIAGIEKEEANNQVFNVGSGIATPVIKVAETLRSLYKSNVQINITGNYRIGDIRHNYADLDKAGAVLGYRPQTGFEEGIRKFSEWVNLQQTEKDTYEKSMAELAAKGLLKQ